MTGVHSWHLTVLAIIQGISATGEWIRRNISKLYIHRITVISDVLKSIVSMFKGAYNYCITDTSLYSMMKETFFLNRDCLERVNWELHRVNLMSNYICWLLFVLESTEMSCDLLLTTDNGYHGFYIINMYGSCTSWSSTRCNTTKLWE